MGTLNTDQKARIFVANVCVDYTSGISRQKKSEQGMRPDLGV
ncbi:hypothetical protein [Bacillus paralicheniformis]|nr:hypothetical protein [Bacillus paralicheniformis]WIG10023.1 hypothetical protein QN340_22980 [Bacillus paralicheniformis]